MDIKREIREGIARWQRAKVLSKLGFPGAKEPWLAPLRELALGKRGPGQPCQGGRLPGCGLRGHLAPTVALLSGQGGGRVLPGVLGGA